MFVTDIQAQETSEKACALDVHYMGAFKDDGHGNPILPPSKNESDDEVSTASSKKTNTGLVLTEMATVQYYAPMTSKSFFTYGSKATSDFAPDPTDPVKVITLTVGDTSFSPSGPINTIVASLFTSQIVHTQRSPEVVAGKYWQNVSKKITTMFPWIFTITPGNNYIVMFAPGQGYSVGHTVIMNDTTGHTASMLVTAVGVSNSILTYTITNNTFNYTTPLPIYTFGGSGNGAAFYNYHI
jgi:hypothetical protein